MIAMFVHVVLSLEAWMVAPEKRLASSTPFDLGVMWMREAMTRAEEPKSSPTWQSAFELL